jgi:hypothetical protein
MLDFHQNVKLMAGLDRTVDEGGNFLFFNLLKWEETEIEHLQSKNFWLLFFIDPSRVAKENLFVDVQKGDILSPPVGWTVQTSGLSLLLARCLRLDSACSERNGIIHK